MDKRMENLGIGMLGKTHSKKTKIKMRESAFKTLDERLKNLSKGWGWNRGLKGYGSFNKGKKRSKVVKENLSRKMKERLKNPENHPCWKGGRIIREDGYVLIRMSNHPRANPKGYVLEHIIICEKKYRKEITKNFIVHHLNGIRNDNRPENLIVVPKGEHSNQLQFKFYRQRILELEKNIQEFPNKFYDKEQVYAVEK